jgi:hypothetical protein
MHHVQTDQAHGTFPFAIKCCNSITDHFYANEANSLAAVSDENGEVRLLDTSPSQETGIVTEYIRMRCHENAIFDISWSYDDYKLVHPVRVELISRQPHRVIKQERSLIS